MDYRLPFSISLSIGNNAQQMLKSLVPRMTSGLDDTLTIVTFAVLPPRLKPLLSYWA
jgi:hypothetical protein